MREDVGTFVVPQPRETLRQVRDGMDQLRVATSPQRTTQHKTRQATPTADTDFQPQRSLLSIGNLPDQETTGHQNATLGILLQRRGDKAEKRRRVSTPPPPKGRAKRRPQVEKEEGAESSALKHGPKRRRRERERGGPQPREDRRTEGRWRTTTEGH